MKNCHICEIALPPFLTTPVLEVSDGSLQECCKQCADIQFPGWDDEDVEDENDGVSKDESL